MPRALPLALFLILALPAAAQQHRPQDREVTVANETDRMLQQLYVSGTGAQDRGPDRLDSNALPPRASLRVPLGRIAACAFEVHAVFDEGDEIRRHVDVCRSRHVVLTDTSPPREVEVTNDTDLDLRELYVWSGSGRDRGRDRLGTLMLAPGESLHLHLRGTRDCVFDLRAVFGDDSEETRSRVDLCRDPRLAFGDPTLPVREVPVLNRARRAIRELYAMPRGAAQSGHWGQDRLGTAMLESHERFRLRVRGRDCTFDLRAVYENSREEVQRNVDLCLVQGVVFGDRELAGSGPRHVTLVNEHRRTIQEAYLSPASSEEWGENALGAEVLPIGARREAELEGDCRADLRIVFDTGAAEERRDIDICALSTVVLRPGWTVEEPLGSGSTRHPVTPQRSGIRLRNAAPLPVVQRHLEPRDGAFGADRLDRTALGAGESPDTAPSDDLPGTHCCCADLTAVVRDGRELRLPGLDLCAGEEVVLQ